MQFGSGEFVKLYNDFGSTDSFEIVPAIRSPTKSCVDESNCNYEKWTLCAFNQTATSGEVSFLKCMDEKKSDTALETPTCGSACTAAKACAGEAGSVDWSSMVSCFNGPLGTTLEQEAADKFNGDLPGSTTIPHTFVDTKDVNPSYSALKVALCAAGSTASVCKSSAACTV
mmetsp:Transcript_58678/g.130718  ORF Transcript_58678/g.130718 Transcript_58678/m.130718 type:complete len:171 (-) Transcript_58678:358-870(-)